MRKWIFPLVLIVTSILTLSAYALDSKAPRVIPNLTFEGTTAHCSTAVSSGSNEIDITMQLFEDGIVIKTWHKSGTGYVNMSQKVTVKKGSTYKLLVAYSIDGETQPSAWVTKKCE